MFQTRRFDAGRDVRRALASAFIGCLRQAVRCRSRDEPPGTRSLTVGYLDGAGERIVLVHLSLRPDGELGTAKLLDPTWLVDDGRVEYYVA